MWIDVFEIDDAIVATLNLIDIISSRKVDGYYMCDTFNLDSHAHMHVYIFLYIFDDCKSSFSKVFYF